VAFLQFQGTDALLELSGPDVVAHALNDLVTEVQRVVDDHQLTFLGTDIDADGGKIILTAGAPRGTGNDEERILRALREIIEGTQHFPLRIGVNRGDVFVGDIGPSYRRTFTVMGDAVNLAARLMAKAEAGQIVATTDVVGRSRTVFETSELEPFLVKGKKLPIRAFGVGPARGTRRTESAVEGPLLGRKDELQTMLDALEKAKQGEGRLINLVGDPGIGKSRLVQELRAQAGFFDVFAATCEQYEASTPYSTFKVLLRDITGIRGEAGGAQLEQIVGETAPELLPWLPLIAIPFGFEVAPTVESNDLQEEFRKLRLHDALGNLLARLLPGPTVFTFEDVHWMDDASGELLRYLIASLPELPWLICLTRVSADSGFLAPEVPWLRSVQLTPLSDDDVSTLAWAETEELRLAPHEISALAKRSGGNPLFLKELVAATQTTDGLDTLPDSVEALITARIDRLPPIERSLLRQAAVLGNSFPEALLLAVLPEEDSVDREAWHNVAEFLEQQADGTYHFRHALMRDVAYEGLPYRLRRELHARVGETIEQSSQGRPEESAELLSLHFFEAQRYDKAWRYSRLAGDRAQAIYANAEAAEFYARAIEGGRRVSDLPQGEVAALFEAMGDVTDRAGDSRKADHAYRAARRLRAGDTIGEARLLLKQGWIRERVGRYSQALQWVRRGHAVLEGVEDPEAAKLRARLFNLHAALRMEEGRTSEAVRWCRRAIEEAEASGDIEAVAHAYTLLGLTLEAMGDPEHSWYSQRALSMYEDLGNLNRQGLVLNHLGVFAYFEGRWNEAVDFYERARVLREKTGDPVNAARGILNIGEILSDQGHIAEAESNFRQAQRVWKAAGYRAGIAIALNYLGRAASRTGRFQEATELLQQARDEYLEVGDLASVAEVNVSLAECLLFQGDALGALSLANDALTSAKRLGVNEQVPVLERIRGQSLMLTGDLGEARLALEESLRVARSRKAGFEVGLTLRAMAELSILTQSPDTGYERESSSILKGLGVVSVPVVPGLPSIPQPGRPDLVISFEPVPVAFE
jgi:class 3 adenylate cyclase/tetratricopeptide (TPR) repeat protein